MNNMSGKHMCNRAGRLYNKTERFKKVASFKAHIDGILDTWKLLRYCANSLTRSISLANLLRFGSLLSVEPYASGPLWVDKEGISEICQHRTSYQLHVCCISNEFIYFFLKHSTMRTSLTSMSILLPYRCWALDPFGSLFMKQESLPLASSQTLAGQEEEEKEQQAPITQRNNAFTAEYLHVITLTPEHNFFANSHFSQPQGKKVKYLQNYTRLLIRFSPLS